MGLTVEFERRANTDAKSGEKAETLKLDDSRKQWFLQNFSPLLSLHLIQVPFSPVFYYFSLGILSEFLDRKFNTRRFFFCTCLFNVNVFVRKGVIV